jgi:hypothetical protein
MKQERNRFPILIKALAMRTIGTKLLTRAISQDLVPRQTDTDAGVGLRLREAMYLSVDFELAGSIMEV